MIVENCVAVEGQGLTQAYGSTQVFRGVDIQLHRGVLGLLGPNGAGKTTLLRTLATIAPPTAGNVTVQGHLVTSDKIARRARRHIGYLPQDFGYLPSFSVFDFVRYCAWLRCVPKTSLRSATKEALSSVGLQGQQHSKMGSLSGGMLRRAGIAAAVVARPPVIFLDEPTVGLDPAQRLEFRNMVRGLSDSCVVLCTHLIEDVAAVCDNVLVMIDGTFCFTGTPSELGTLGTGSESGDSPLERGYMSVVQNHRCTQ